MSISLNEDDFFSAIESFTLRSWQAIRLYQLFVLNQSFTLDLPRQVGKSYLACIAASLGALVVCPQERMKKALLHNVAVLNYDLNPIRLVSKNFYTTRTFVPHGIQKHIIIYDEVPPPILKTKHIVGCMYTSPALDRQGTDSHVRNRFVRKEREPELLNKIKSLEEEIRVLNASW